MGIYIAVSETNVYTILDMDTPIHTIKHPKEALSLFSEIVNQASLINFSKKSEKLEVKQSIRWGKFKFSSFDITKKSN